MARAYSPREDRPVRLTLAIAVGIAPEPVWLATLVAAPGFAVQFADPCAADAVAGAVDVFRDNRERVREMRKKIC